MTDLILHHANIYTLNPQQPWAEAVACANGVITAVGSNAEILALGNTHTERINAEGRLVLPGFTDSHVHFLQYAIRQHEVNLLGIHDIETVRRRVTEAVAAAPPDSWVLGWGWAEGHWGVEPHRHLLDEWAGSVPVVLRRLDMHTVWANSAALHLAGIGLNTPNPPESIIERDADGRPNGLLREWNAIKLIDKHIPRPTSQILRQWMLEAQTEAHRLGLTGIHDQRVQHEGRGSLRQFQHLHQQGHLKLRVHHNLAAEHLTEATTLGLFPGFGDDRLWLGHIKTFADGTLGSRTALMLDPFENEPDNTGVAITPVETLVEMTRQAALGRFSLSVHAIGDLAVRQVLAVFADHPPAEGMLPHRIEHVQLIHPDDIPRLAECNVVAAVQPIHLSFDWLTANRVWGERSRYAYAFRSLLDAGVRLALGSDAPVAPLNPMLGLYAAVTRQDMDGLPGRGWYPMERISMAEAIHGYTMGPAYVAGKSTQQGSIAVGKWADMIALSHNLFDIKPSAIPNTQVELTVFAGAVVHRTI